MTAREQDEYSALRATIRERGTARVCIFVAGVAAWTAATIATAALASSPIAALLPLLLLACVFEAIFALHVGVERIGRYLQVFHESAVGDGLKAVPNANDSVGNGDPRWEHAAMAFGRPRGAASSDALFTVPFLLAALFNMAPALLLNPIRAELIFVGGAHVLFALRLVVARRRGPAARDRSPTVSATETRATLTTKPRRTRFVFSWLGHVIDAGSPRPLSDPSQRRLAARS